MRRQSDHSLAGILYGLADESDELSLAERDKVLYLLSSLQNSSVCENEGLYESKTHCPANTKWISLLSQVTLPFCSLENKFQLSNQGYLPRRTHSQKSELVPQHHIQFVGSPRHPMPHGSWSGWDPSRCHGNYGCLGTDWSIFLDCWSSRVG